MEKIVVLDAKTIGEHSIFERFKDFGTVTIYDTTLPNQRISNISDATIIITNKVVIDKEIFDACKTIKLICLTATGMNNVDLPYASQLGILVKNVAGYSTESVAQHTFALLFSYLHSITYYNSFVKSGEYSTAGLFTHMAKPYFEIKNKTWGIVGLGAIGKRVAEIARVFGCKVIYYSTSGKNTNSEHTQVSLQDLLEKSDIISIHAPLNEQTNNLFTYAQLSQMKPSAILINVGRGGIIHEDDLACALQEKKIKAALLDVMKQEPLPIQSKLLDTTISDGILITPHIAWISTEALSTLLQKVYENIKLFLEAGK